MCLNYLKRFSVKGDTGYKVMIAKKVDGKTTFRTPYREERRVYRRGQWKIAKRVILRVDNYSSSNRDNRVYYSGFHIFLSKRSAELYSKAWLSKGIVVKVQFKDVVATGMQETGGGKAVARCIVARHMKVVSKAK